ncbi:SDR family oxidoreductase [Ideonella sp. 4Y16]|uniref:SDR family oxidoreductase n=1 Tax=Ideonella alba TaxID=2824118 RepID=A0A940YBK7_9BURK|nr:SDR family oxidoreductase [Ideonella alba]MBQ0933534.1 SDR family oxidoreductase [Ideonella alba]MBQ0946488.1 SDR family oxidoreductase [Ideonella alba]
MYAVTGANGQLGRLVIRQLIARGVPPAQIAALVRRPAQAADLAALGVALREADYDRPDTLAAALAGVDRLLLISSSEVGRRAPQHQAVIDAARAAGVGFLAYTSLLHADRSPLGLAAEHVTTEAALRASGLPHALLRHGWYTENYLASLPPALQHGAFIGAAGEGRISSATRQDYAEADAAVLLAPPASGTVLELAGDEAYTLAEFAAELGRQSGRSLPYVNLPQAEFEAALAGAGLPAPLAALLADSDAGAAQGALFDGGRALSALIQRPTTPLAQAMAAALR